MLFAENGFKHHLVLFLIATALPATVASVLLSLESARLTVTSSRVRLKRPYGNMDVQDFLLETSAKLSAITACLHERAETTLSVASQRLTISNDGSVSKDGVTARKNFSRASS